MKKIVSIIMCIALITTITGCGKAKRVADVIFESETTAASAITAPQTTTPETSVTYSSDVVLDVPITASIPNSMDVINQVIDIYNNPENVDMHAYYDTQYDALVVFIYGETGQVCLDATAYPEGTKVREALVESMLGYRDVAQTTYTLFKENHIPSDVWVVYSTAMSTGTSALWSKAWIAYSAIDDNWTALTD